MNQTAQTNLQLYNQMFDCGYPLRDIELVCAAYKLATQVFNCLYRGSGKPLICHLVGVASLLVSAERPAVSVAAGLLHASFGDGDFGKKSPKEIVEEKCGSEVSNLIESYISLNYTYTEEYVQKLANSYREFSAEKREAIVIRIANEIEDYVDHSIEFYSDDLNKGYNWRVEYVETTFPLISQLAKEIGQDKLAETINSIVKENRLIDPYRLRVPLDSCLRTSGKMYFLLPFSLSFALSKFIMNGLKKIKARLKSLL